MASFVILKKARNMLLDILFPNRCLHCNLIIDGNDILCEDCLYQLPYTHFGQENELLTRGKPLFPLEDAFALLHFDQDNLAQKVIHQLKYSGKEHFGKHLAKWTLEKLHFKDSLDLLVTIPLHPKKERKRGYNQLHAFGKILSEELKIPLDNQLLKRNFYNKAQAQQDKSHRAEIGNLFSTTRDIHNQHILLIDDVFTTGNTMASAVWEILKFPGNRISILVMALD